MQVRIRPRLSAVNDLRPFENVEHAEPPDVLGSVTWLGSYTSKAVQCLSVVLQYLAHCATVQLCPLDFFWSAFAQNPSA